jgi:hydroxymethylpyrimidine/phosphomethylpyrimidine kinase
MPPTPPVVLTIAGFDPSSGAGITADIKTIAAHGCYGVACITALTVQSTAGVRRTKATDTSLVTETLEELNQDVDIAAVRIGMLASATVAQAVATFLEKARLPNVVLDPILKSSSGADLLERSGTRVLTERLLPLCAIVTPNVDEAAALTGLPVTNPEEMRAAAAKLNAMGAPSVVVTNPRNRNRIPLTEQAVPSPAPSPAISLMAAVSPMLYCLPKPTSVPPSPTPTR